MATIFLTPQNSNLILNIIIDLKSIPSVTLKVLNVLVLQETQLETH
jgi:hypothetical protein